MLKWINDTLTAYVPDEQTRAIIITVLIIALIVGAVLAAEKFLVGSDDEPTGISDPEEQEDMR